MRGLAAGWGTTAMLVAAVAIGTGFQIPNTANLDGLHDALLEDGLTYGAGDIRVEPRDRAQFREGAEIVAKIRAAIPLRHAVPSLTFPGAVGVKGRFLGAPIIGVDPAEPQPFHVTEGRSLEPRATDHPTPGTIPGGILLGATIAQRLELEVGDTVDLRVLYGGKNPLGESNLGRFTAQIRGIVTASSGAYRFVFLDRALLSEEAGMPGAASSIAVHLDDHDAARALAPTLAAAVPEATAIAWRDDEVGFASYLDARDVIGGVSYAMVIAAIAIPMWALLYIQVLRRRRELAILRSIGFTRREVAATCVLQALSIAAVGCAIGAGLGTLAIRYFEANPLFEWESLRVRPVASASTFLIPMAVILATAVLAALHPAWRASRVEPAGALRRIE
jgi:lipoprotein-releasing system permease protein